MKFTFGKLTATAVAAVTALAISVPAQSAEVLKVTTALGTKHDQSTAFLRLFVDKMKEDESLVKLNYLGGPEVTPNRKQGPAMKRGLIDIIMSPCTYYSGIVAEARLHGIAPVPSSTWRKNGAFDIMSRAWAKKLNAVILGWGNFYGFNSFYLWMKDKPKLSKVTGLNLKGVKMRTTALYTPFLKAMGATTKNISPAEVYTALERGTVDGLAWPEGGVAFRGWQRFIKWRIEPGFFRSTTMATMNKTRFDKLPKKARDQIIAAGLHYENNSGPMLEKLAKIDNAKVYKEGVQRMMLPPDIAKVYINTIISANWKTAEKYKYLEDFQKMKALMTVSK